MLELKKDKFEDLLSQARALKGERRERGIKKASNENIGDKMIVNGFRY